MHREKVRVLMVEDSTAVRRILSAYLTEDPDIEIVGEAADGEEAIRKADELKPDIITMDILMPKMNGFEAIKHIMAYNPTPILVITGIPMKNDRNLFSEALRLGALDIVEKPTLAGAGQTPGALDRLRQKIRSLSKAKVITHLDGKLSEWRRRDEVLTGVPFIHDGIICIGSSAGGPEVLVRILNALPENPGVPILIAQHLAAFFIEDFVALLQRHCKFPIRRAIDKDVLNPGQAFVSQGDHHMVVRSNNTVEFLIPDRDDIFIPSVDRLFKSCAEIFNAKTLGIVLSGMGDDGVKGARAIRENKGIVISQEEAGCPIFGMPKAVIDANLADKICSVEDIPVEMMRFSATIANAAIGRNRSVPL